jgi:hypothetical protein
VKVASIAFKDVSKSFKAASTDIKDVSKSFNSV